jgi:hypothetical protein
MYNISGHPLFGCHIYLLFGERASSREQLSHILPSNRPITCVNPKISTVHSTPYSQSINKNYVSGLAYMLFRMTLK